MDLGTDKLYFKIGEVAEIVGVAPHVLRYWETEFSKLRPAKSSRHQRVYRRSDVETLLRIKHLLYVERFTIAGARKRLKEVPVGAMAAPSPAYVARGTLLRVRTAMAELRALVEGEVSRRAADPAALVQRAGGVSPLATP